VSDPQQGMTSLDGITDAEMVEWTLGSLEAIAAAAERTGEVPVPSCPLWTMSDLVAHVGRLYSGWYRYNLTREPGNNDSLTAKDSAEPLPDKRLEFLVPYLRRAATGWAETVAARDLDRPVWALILGTEPARFWLRRAVSESAIHRWDAESTAGAIVPTPARQAAMSIDETLTGLWPATIRSSDHPELVDLRALERRRTEPMRLPPLPNEPISYLAVDSSRSWNIQVVDRTLMVERDGPLASARLVGAGHDIHLYMWGRATTSQLVVQGDSALLDALNITALAAP
jgi:hypothetical protein